MIVLDQFWFSSGTCLALCVNRRRFYQIYPRLCINISKISIDSMTFVSFISVACQPLHETAVKPKKNCKHGKFVYVR